MEDSVRTILVVEDDDGVRNLIRTLLRLAGFEVVSCQDGSEALDLMAVRGGNIHLMVTDVNLGPDMDGVEMAEHLRTRHPSLKVLYISGAEEQERLRDEIACGRAHFMMKPFTPRGLTETAKSILAGRSVTSPVSR